jgi:hypothetical protein
MTTCTGIWPDRSRVPARPSPQPQPPVLPPVLKGLPNRRRGFRSNGSPSPLSQDDTSSFGFIPAQVLSKSRPLSGCHPIPTPVRLAVAFGIDWLWLALSGRHIQIALGSFQLRAHGNGLLKVHRNGSPPNSGASRCTLVTVSRHFFAVQR